MTDRSLWRLLRRLVLAAACLCAATGAAGATTWDAYTYLSSGQQAGVRGLSSLFAQLRQETAGALAITLHQGGSLPIAGLLRPPMLLRNSDEYARAAAIAAPYVAQAYDRKGIVVLGQFVYPLQTIWSRRRLTRLADIKGQKLRVTSVEMGEFVRRFGGIPLTMGTADVAAALDRGVVDAVLTASSGAGMIWKDLLKYNYRFPVQYANAIMIVNRGAFTALPSATQTLLRRDVDASQPVGLGIFSRMILLLVSASPLMAAKPGRMGFTRDRLPVQPPW